jgi:hypothetical protein
VRTCGNCWFRLKFHYPLIWLPTPEYQQSFEISEREEEIFWKRMEETGGYYTVFDNGHDKYNINNLHKGITLSESD